jgi:para-nitrobenzyl esterase
MAATSDIIVVFTQYRLGVLGWLPPKVAPTAGDPNYALKDIVTSLEVIRDNVAAFGGNPSAVTVGGQSAGASMTRALWGTPASKGLYRGMIMHSDPIVSTIQ